MKEVLITILHVLMLRDFNFFLNGNYYCSCCQLRINIKTLILRVIIYIENVNLFETGEITDTMSDDQSLWKPTRLSKKLSLHLRKQEGHSLSSKDDEALVTENHLSTGSELERGHQNVVELDKWTLQLISDQRLSLAGYIK